jgi:hypothetical protein
MAHDYDPEDTARRSKRDRIARLRKRISMLSDTDETVMELRGILQGILDLLEDEL